MELGPCRISDANGPRYHLESWNQNANIFFVDQPIGVGFSYAEYGESVVRAQPCFTALIGLLSHHVGRALPKKLRKISQRLCQYSLRTSRNSKVVLFIWRENRMGYAGRFNLRMAFEFRPFVRDDIFRSSLQRFTIRTPGSSKLG
jgi:hypothetical protein